MGERERERESGRSKEKDANLNLFLRLVFQDDPLGMFPADSRALRYRNGDKIATSYCILFYFSNTQINSFYGNFTLNSALQQTDISDDFINNNITATQFCHFVDELVGIKIFIHLFHALLFLFGEDSGILVLLNVYTYFGEVAGTWLDDDNSEEGRNNNDPAKLKGHAQHSGKFLIFHVSSFCLYLLW